MKTLLLAILTTACCAGYAQEYDKNNVVLLTNINDSSRLWNNVGFYIDSTHTMNASIAWNQPFIAGDRIPWEATKFIPIQKVPHHIYFQFTVFNNNVKKDTLYLYPGMRFNATTYKLVNNQPQQQPETRYNRDGYVQLPFDSAEKVTYLVQLVPCKRADNRFAPMLIRNEFLSSFTTLLYNRGSTLSIFGFLLSGILLTMIIFTLINYIANFKKEFLYYCGFAVCIFFLIWLLSIFLNRPGPFSNFLLAYLSTALLMVGTIFYSAFTRKFLHTKTDYKKLDRLFVLQEYLLLALMLLYTYLHFFTTGFEMQYLLEMTMKIVALLIGIVYLVLAFTQRNWLMTYLAVGNALYILFSLASLYIIIQKNKSVLPGPPLLYFEIGLVLAIVAFLIGLIQKNRKELVAQTKKEEELIRLAEKEKLESQLAVLKAQQDERNRISADMHDDLGAGMTAIRLYSELAKNKTGNNAISEIDKISSSANELLNKMNAIIWSMNSNNDTLKNLVAYIRRYALDYFEGTKIDCRISLPEQLPDVEVPGDMRRNIFLVFKEALNNIVKHSAATKVTITLTKTDNLLELNIHDNGKGIDMDNLREFGNGLNNMKKRMQDSNIEFEIKKLDGTLLTLKRIITFTGSA